MKRSQITPWLGPPRGHRVSSQTVPVRLKCHVGRSLGKEHPVGGSCDSVVGDFLEFNQANRGSLCV